MKTRVLILTQWFDPEPTFKGLVFAKELVRLGYEVEVVTGFPNYPGGNIYPGYRIKLIQREMIDGVEVTRVPLFPSHGQSKFKRMFNYASFAVSSLYYGLFVAKRANVIYAYHPPLTVGISASLIRVLRRIPVVYDIQDMWPDTLRATGMISNPRIINIVASICRWVYRRVDYIVVLSPGFKRLLLERGVPEDKIEVIFNWANEEALVVRQGQVPANFPTAERFRIVFAGNMGKAQALDTILDAAQLLKEWGSTVSFVMLGGGVEVGNLKQRASELKLNNVVFLPPVSMDKVGTVFYEADVLLVHLRKDPLFEVTIPSKTQAYMIAGKPILMAIEGDAAELVRVSKGGCIASSEDAQQIAEVAEKMSTLGAAALVEMGNNAKNYYNSKMALSVGVSKFSDVFKKVRKL